MLARFYRYSNTFVGEMIMAMVVPERGGVVEVPERQPRPNDR